jgi:hypothetical protein
MEVEFRLVDVNTNQTAWMSSTFTAGNAYATLDTLCNSLAAKITEKLKADGMLASAPGAPTEKRKLAESERPKALPKSEAAPVSPGLGGRANEPPLGRQKQLPGVSSQSKSPSSSGYEPVE